MAFKAGYTVLKSPTEIPAPLAGLTLALVFPDGRGGDGAFLAPGAKLGRSGLSVQSVDQNVWRLVRDLGGQGIEVISGAHKDDEIAEFASVARKFGFLASRASDFHGPGESWIDLGEGERIALTGLPPGRYTLELGAARTSSQRWATTTWSFVIRPPWWRTWWFMLLMLAWVATIGTFLVRYRLGQRLREQDMRDRLARDLHDDIGSTLGSISYFSELGKQQLDAADIEAARGVMERMGVRSREMIGRMSDIVWSVDPKHDGATSLVERMKLFAAETLATRDIALQFDTHEGVEGLKLDMAQRRELYLVLKEAMTNVAKHAACTRVKVTLERNHGTVRLVVEDDGKGLQRSKPDLLNGSGLSSMHKRAAALGGTLVVAEADGGGTRVILSVPLRGIAS